MVKLKEKKYLMMNHVPVKWLRWIRLGLIGYSGLFLAGYGLVAVGMHTGWNGGHGFTPLLAGIIVAQMVYELTLGRELFARRPELAALVSFELALMQTLIIAEATGVYNSPYFLLVFGLVFLGQAIGPFVSPSVVALLMVGFSLGVSGQFSTPTNTTNGAGIITISTVLTVVSYLFWRRFYTNAHTSLDELSSSLHSERTKSDIIVNAIDDGVVLIEADNTIQLFNPAAAAITGWKAEETIGLDYHAVLRIVDVKNAAYPEEQNPFSRAFKEAHAVRDNTGYLKTQSDKTISVGINVSPLAGPGGKVSAVVGIFRDVSEERGEEQRRAEFISTASHEMRTPVAAIEGYLALALNERVSTIDSKAREFLEKAHTSTQHLGVLFQDLLTSAKAEDGRLSSHPQAVEISSFLEHLSDDLRFAAEKKGLAVEFVTGSNNQVIDASQGEGSKKVVKPFYYVYVDPDRLREVITNLFDNAVKYTESGKISIGLTGNTSLVQMYIRDTGPGIPTEDQQHLFQKFYRVDTSATRTIGGTGLGLFICRKIVELYNGRIWVESELEKGSTFFIDLPRIDANKAAQLQAAEAAHSSPLRTL